MRKAVMIYFVLYIVLITELLVVITERDDLHEEEQKILRDLRESIVESFNENVSIDVPQESSFHVVSPLSETNIVLIPNGLVSKEEQENIEYIIKISPGHNIPDGWPKDQNNNIIPELSSKMEFNEDSDFRLNVTPGGVGEFIAKFNARDDNKTFKFDVNSNVKRTYPLFMKTNDKLRDFIAKPLTDSIKSKFENNLPENSSIFSFVITVKFPGVSTWD